LIKEFIEAVKQHIAASPDVNAKIVSGSMKGDTPTDNAEDETATSSESTAARRVKN
jgi:hypothetical protein